MSASKKVAYGGLFTAMALIFSYIETLFVIPSPVPGIKLGLCNLVILLALYILGRRASFSISMIRVFMAAAMFSGFGSFPFSLGGALLSFLVMACTFKMPFFSPIGVSILGAVAHNFGQVLVAAIVVENMMMFYYLIPLTFAGIVVGFINGFLFKMILPLFKKPHIESTYDD